MEVASPLPSISKPTLLLPEAEDVTAVPVLSPVSESVPPLPTETWAPRSILRPTMSAPLPVVPLFWSPWMMMWELAVPVTMAAVSI